MTRARSIDDAIAQVRDRRPATALHEAAHLFAAYAADLPLPVTVAIVAGGGHNLRDTRSGPAEARIAMLVAGGVAEAIAEYPDPWRGTSGPGDRGDAHDATRLAEAEGLEPVSAIRAGIGRATRQLLRSWPVVLELAERLDAAGRLEGRQVDEALEQALTARRRRGDPDPHDYAATTAHVERVLASWAAFTGAPATRVARAVGLSTQPPARRSAPPAAARPGFVLRSRGRR